VRHFGGDRAVYIRDLIEKDIYGASAPRAAINTKQRQKQTFTFPRKKRPFDPQQWEADLKVLALGAEKIPVLPPFAFTRESIYGNYAEIRDVHPTAITL
jgi:hypothetical protein